MQNDLISRSALLEKQQWFADQFDCDCFPFIDPEDVENAPAVDAVPVESLGKIGKLFLPYKGCPRGHVGRMGVPATLEEEALQWGVITDADGGRWVPVVEDVLHELIEKAKTFDAVEVVRCKDCERIKQGSFDIFKLAYCDLWKTEMQMDNYCCFGNRRADDGK